MSSFIARLDVVTQTRRGRDRFALLCVVLSFDPCQKELREPIRLQTRFNIVAHHVDTTLLDTYQSARMLGMATATHRAMKPSILLSALVASLSLTACGDEVVVKSPDDEHHEEHVEQDADRAADKADRAADKADEAAEEAQEAKDKAD